MNFLFLSFFIVSLFSYTVSAKSYLINSPRLFIKNGHNEMNYLRKRSSLLGSNQFIKRFLRVLETDIARFEDSTDKDDIKLLRDVVKRCRKLMILKDKDKKIEVVDQILEIAATFSFDPLKKENRRAGVNINYYLSGIMNSFWKDFNFSLVEGNPGKYVRVANLSGKESTFLSISDLESIDEIDKIDPVESAFWHKRYKEDYETFQYSKDRYYQIICNSNLAMEFRKKKKMPEFGGGRNGGVKVKLIDPTNGKKIKLSVKFALKQEREKPLFYKQEAFVESGVTSIYRALGYNVDRNFYCHNVKFKYHPEFLRLTKSKLVNVVTWDLRKFYKSFTLKDGTILPYEQVINEFKYLDHSGTTTENPWGRPIIKYSVKDRYKSKIAYINLYGAHIEHRPKRTERYLRWKRVGLSHEDRRELRALPIIDAWLGDGDPIGFNQKMVVKYKKKKDPGIAKLEFALVDNGDAFSFYTNDLENYEFGFLPPELRIPAKNGDQIAIDKLMKKYIGFSELELRINYFSFSIFRDGTMSKRPPKWYIEEERVRRIFRDIHFFDPGANKSMSKYVTWSDCRWAVRQIAKLSEEQILKAMSMSGLGFNGAKLVTEKLISRRDQLVKYFDLSHEIKPLRENGPDLYMESWGDGFIKVNLKDGTKKRVKINSFGHYVTAGKFVFNIEKFND